jgi:hypothetical protein
MTKQTRKPKPAAVVAARLARLKATPVAPEWLITAATGSLTPAGARRLSQGDALEKAMQAVHAEAQAVAHLVQAVHQMPPAWPRRPGDTLL